MLSLFSKHRPLCHYVPLYLPSELTDVCKRATEVVEEEVVTELDAGDVPGIVCI